MSNQLLERREELRTVIAELKEELSDLNEQIQDTWLQQVRDALRADGKDFGTTTIVSNNKKLNQMNVDIIDVTLTTVAAAIGNNEVISQSIEFADAVAVKGGSGIVQSIVLLNKDNTTESPAIEILFAEDDSAIASDEGNAITASDTTLFKLQGSVTVSNWSVLKPSDNELATKSGIGLAIQAVSGSRDVYIHAVNRSGGNYTPSGTDVLRMKIGILQD